MIIKSSVAILALFGLLFGAAPFAKAQAPTPSPSHDEHHPEAGSAEMKGAKSNMMDKMDMNQMMGMMDECMGMHKDGKMCEHQTMEQCQEKMDKVECQKMMKDVKKEKKKAKNRK